MNRRFAILIVAAFGAMVVISVPPASALETLYINGAYWKQLTATEKERFVVGVLVGYNSGFQDGRSMTLDTMRPLIKGAMLPQPTQPQFAQKPAVYVGAIDAFYAKYPDLETRVPISELLDCVSDHATVSCDKIAEFWHSHPPGSGL
ncbi:MAG TPA: hypothetical protein VKF82_07980 [Candidatus Eremiobacteraceae bacterium]|nr:hypothetical protein [Candidatus Eremiobacteraceae bacterium]